MSTPAWKTCNCLLQCGVPFPKHMCRLPWTPPNLAADRAGRNGERHLPERNVSPRNVTYCFRFSSAARVDHSNGGRETWGAGVLALLASLPSCTWPAHQTLTWEDNTLSCTQRMDNERESTILDYEPEIPGWSPQTRLFRPFDVHRAGGKVRLCGSV
jgi:hypothetical protein